MAIGKEPWTIPAGFNGETDQKVEALEFEFSEDECVLVLQFEPQMGRSTSVRAPITRGAAERFLDLLPVLAERYSR